MLAVRCVARISVAVTLEADAHAEAENGEISPFKSTNDSQALADGNLSPSADHHRADGSGHCRTWSWLVVAGVMKSPATFRSPGQPFHRQLEYRTASAKTSCGSTDMVIST